MWGWLCSFLLAIYQRNIPAFSEAAIAVSDTYQWLGERTEDPEFQRLLVMRRLLKEIAGGGAVKGDTTTLEDFSVIAKLRVDEE